MEEQLPSSTLVGAAGASRPSLSWLQPYGAGAPLAHQSSLSLCRSGWIMLRFMTPKENANHEFNFLISPCIQVRYLDFPYGRGPTSGDALCISFHVRVCKD